MYREVDDNEIIYMIRDNNDNYSYLLNKYRPLIVDVCKPYMPIAKKTGYELDDLIQIANLAILDAIKSYSENKNVLFSTYMSKCIKNRLNNEFRNQMTNKKKTLNKAIPYDELYKGIFKAPIEVIADKNALEPLDFLINENLEITYTNFLNSLPFETAVAYEMRRQDFSFQEISKFLHVELKTIKKYVASSKRKLNRIREEFEV